MEISKQQMWTLKLICHGLPTSNPWACTQEGTFHHGCVDISVAANLKNQLSYFISQAHVWLPFGLYRHRYTSVKPPAKSLMSRL